MQYIAHQDNTLNLAQTEKPSPAKHEVLIQVKAIGVNRADCLQRQGKYPAPQGDSDILGLECAGVVVECGDDVAANWLGKRVFSLCAGGAYAEYVAVDAEQIMPLSDSMTWAQGAAISEVYLTAYDALFRFGKLQAGQCALIHAGGSGVAGAAIQMAKMRGATVVTTAGCVEKCEHALSLGADHAINYKQQDFVDMMKAHALKAHVIVDPIAGRYLNKNVQVAALDCQIIMLAFLDSRFADVDLARLLQKRISLHASTLRNRSIEYKRALKNAFETDFYSAIKNEQFDFNIYKTLPWQSAQQAHTILDNNENSGKVILTVE